MNNYPEHLAPELNENSRNPITPFEEWWPRVKHGFPNVPREVAKEWLYRHWGYSPFSWIESKSYNFLLDTIPTSNLKNILNKECNFNENPARAIDYGRSYCNEPHKKYVVKYMIDNGTFPSPIIVLDNRENHLLNNPDANNIPQALILVEGHSRHEIGLYLNTINKMNNYVDIYLLTKI